MPLEFKRRDTYEHLTDMVGGGPFDLDAGYWTDDTSMAICLAESILARDAIDAEDLRARWIDWWKNGVNSSIGRCFDIGAGTAAALRSGVGAGEGNGSLMRLAPVVLRWPLTNLARRAAIAQAAVTHGEVARGLTADLAQALVSLINGEKIDISGTIRCQRSTREEISSSGYCVDTMRAALWCLHNTTDFRDAVLLAANLGDDADTVAAVTGQLAGARYGASGVPADWLRRLHEGPRILALADALIDAGVTSRASA